MKRMITTMKITKTRLKEIIKEELENVLEGVEKAWCVGFEKDGETAPRNVFTLMLVVLPRERSRRSTTSVMTQSRAPKKVQV